jgi:DNA-binding NarL/FixJ family response regulator/transcriptional regulator with GAF, ATPase, and Fis domain
MAKQQQSLNQHHAGDHAGAPVRASGDFSAGLLVIGKLLIEAQSLYVVFDSLVAQLARMLDFDHISVARFDRSANSFVITNFHGTAVDGWDIGSRDEFEGRLFDAIITDRRGVYRSKSRSKGASSALSFEAGLRSMIATPLLVRGEVRGLLAIKSTKADTYGERDVAKLQQVADLLAPAIQHYETQSDLQRQLLEKTVFIELARDLSGITEFSEFFPVITQAAGRLFEFDVVKLRAFDPSRGQIIAELALEEGVQINNTSVPVTWSGTAAVAIAERTSGFILTPDQINEPDSGWTSFKYGLDKFGIKSVLAMPLVYRGRAVGSLVFLSKIKNNYSGRDIAFVEQLAAQLSGAVATAVQHAELRRLVHERTVFSDISKIAARSDTLRSLFEGMGDRLSGLIHYDRLEVISVNEETGASQLAFIDGVPVDGLTEGAAVEHQLYGAAAPAGAGQITAKFGTADEKPVPLSQHHGRPGLNSWLQIPIRASGRLFGFLILHSRETAAYGPLAIDLLERVLEHVTPALEHIVENTSNERRIRQKLALGEIGVDVFAAGSPVEMCDRVADHLRDLMEWDLLEISLPPDTVAGAAPGTSIETSTFRTSTVPKAQVAQRERFTPFVDKQPATEPRSLLRVIDASSPTADRAVPEDFLSALSKSGISSAIAAPINDGGGTPGHIVIGCVQPGMFNRDDLRNLEVAAGYLSAASRRYPQTPAIGDSATVAAAGATQLARFDENDLARQKSIGLVIVDRMPICRGGYSALFESTPLDFIDAADSIASAIQLEMTKSASVILMELHEENPSEIRRLIEETRLPVLLISERVNKTLMSDAVAVGASGLLLKGISVDRLVEAVVIVAEGGSIFDPGLLGGFLSTLRPHEVGLTGRDEVVLGLLTDPELRLLGLIAGGKSNQEISEIERFTVGTIKNRLARLYKKIDATNRVDATRIAYRAGLVR